MCSVKNLYDTSQIGRINANTHKILNAIVSVNKVLLSYHELNGGGGSIISSHEHKSVCSTSINFS
jgi:hypothetical protein